MRVAFITSEVLPYSKTGGLADVSQALPRALAGQGDECTVFSPYYRQAAQWLEQHQQAGSALDLERSIWIGQDQRPLRYRLLQSGAVRHVFTVNDWYYDRPQCYQAADDADFEDNAARFAFFCRAVLEYYLEVEPAPDIFHVHDWQAALIPVYLKTIYQQPSFSETKSLLTIHNLGYPGLFPAECIYDTGLNWDIFTHEQLEYYGQLNLLKGGIVFADAINTVSPAYAREIQTAEYGFGLEGVLTAHRGKLHGILNGIDERQWNPLADPHIAAHYSAEEFAGKKACKRALQREMGLPLRAGAFVLGVISRLDHQKGIMLLADAFPGFANLDLQLVMLGSGDPALQEQLRALAGWYPEQVALRLDYDEPLAHRIVAGADAFVMPSFYEPCGLTQMYSQRYGTVPVVRATGGLKDTVVNYPVRRTRGNKATGFSFKQPTTDALAGAIQRAAQLYFSDRSAWNKLARRIMTIDNSWNNSARAYRELYHVLAGREKATAAEQRHG